MVRVSMIKVSNIFSHVPPLFSELAKSITGEIECSLESIQKYSTTKSPYTIRPQAILYPKNVTDIKHILSFAREYTMPVTVRGNGTSNTGGSIGEGIIIDMTRYFNHIRQINVLDQTITVDAGVTIKKLREQLHALHVDIPILTAQNNHSTIASLLATKSVTPTSFRQSTIREWVENITIVVDTGEEHHIRDGVSPSGRLLGIYQSIFPILTENGPMLRASKPDINDDATGYALWNTSIGPRQLINHIVGSEGTLGIITTVTLRLTPLKQYTETICIPIQEKESMHNYIEKAVQHNADHIFLYDSTFMELTDRYRSETLLSFPDASYALCISFYGNSQEHVKNCIKKYTHETHLQNNNSIVYEDSSFIEKITETSFLENLLQTYTQGSLTPIYSCDALIVSNTKYALVLEELETYLYSTGKLYVITGNAGSGHISVITLFNPLSLTYEQEIENYTQTIFTIIKKYKGGISAKDGEGISRTPYLPFVYNEATIDIFKKIKEAWDPLHIFNPGKKLGITLNYSKEHLTRKKLS